MDARGIRAKREQLKTFQGLLPERQDQNLAVTALCVPYSLDSEKDNRLWTGASSSMDATGIRVIPRRSEADLISQKVFTTSFCESQF